MKHLTRILVADPQLMVAEGIRRIINEEKRSFSVVETLTDGRVLLAAVERQKPDLLITDIAFPSGIELLKQVKAAAPNILVVVLTALPQSIYLKRVFHTHAEGFVSKLGNHTSLLDAVTAVLAGGIYANGKKMDAKLLQSLLSKHDPTNPCECLSDRELEVLALLGTGLGTRAVADVLRVSFKTIESHRANIKKKLGIPDAPTLIQFAIRWRSDGGIQ